LSRSEGQLFRAVRDLKQKRLSIYVDDKGNDRFEYFLYLHGEDMENEGIFIYCLAECVANSARISDNSQSQKKRLLKAR